MCDWPTTLGKGFSRYGPEVAGIPTDIPIWEYCPLSKQAGPETGMSVLCEQHFLFLGTDGHIGCIQLNDSSLSWLIKLDHAGSRFPSTDGIHFFVEPVILSAESGEVLLNYEKEVERYERTSRGKPVSNGTWMIKSWHELTEDCRLLCVDLDGFTVSCIENGVYFPQFVPGTSHIVGATPKGIRRVDIKTNEIVWQTDISSSPSPQGAASSVFSGTGLMFFCDNWYAFDTTSGEIIRKFQFSELAQGMPKSNALFSANTDQYIYVHGGGGYRHLVGYDYLNGRTLFDVPAENVLRFCIAGDLIFAINDIVYRSGRAGSELIAIDRYTGEQVWTAQDLLEAAHDVKVSGNKVLVSSMSGVVRCYEWREQYRSLSATSRP